MQTKPTESLRLSVVALPFFLLAFTIYTEVRCQNIVSIHSQVAAIPGIQTSCQGPFAIASNPAFANSKYKHTFSINWAAIAVGTPLNFSSASFLNKVKKAALGLQLNHLGYSTSSINSLHISMAQSWNDNISSGLSIFTKWTHVKESRVQMDLPNVVVGHAMAFNKTQLSCVIQSPIPDEEVGLLNTQFTLGLRYLLSLQTDLYFETALITMAKPRFVCGVEQQVKPNVSFQLSTGIHPQTFGFGLSITPKQTLKIQTTSSFKQSIGFTPSMNLQWQK